MAEGRNVPETPGDREIHSPTTREEWQEAADAAVWALGLNAAMEYGLMKGPAVDVARCNAVLFEAPRHGAVIHTIEEILAEDLRRG